MTVSRIQFARDYLHHTLDWMYFKDEGVHTLLSFTICGRLAVVQTIEGASRRVTIGPYRDTRPPSYRVARRWRDRVRNVLRDEPWRAYQYAPSAQHPA